MSITVCVQVTNVFSFFDPLDVWVNRIQKLGGCVFFWIIFGSLKGCTVVSLAIKLRSKDLKHFTLGNGHPRLQG